MKLTDFGLVFVIIFICFSTVTDSRLDINAAVSIEQIAYNRAVDTAISDALFMMVEYDDGSDISINPDRAVDSFIKSLCINLGMNVGKENTEKLKEYIPVIIFVLKDGYIVFYHDEQKEDSQLCDRFISTGKIPYEYEEGNLIYHFELDDMVTVLTPSDYVRGSVHDVRKMYSASIMEDMEEYEHIKSRVIIDSITESLKKYTSNEYYKKGNDEWSFFIPYEDDDVWSRTIQDIGMITVFSGYPYSDTSLGYYSKFAFGGARIWKKE